MNMQIYKLYLILVNLNLCYTQNNINQCKNNTDCDVIGENLTCVSVQTNHTGLLFVSQCISGLICSGSNFGNCPDFTNWPIRYSSINPKCIFSIITKCNNETNNNAVDCYNISNYKEHGIYKCIDIGNIKVNNYTDSPITKKPNIIIIIPDKSSAYYLTINILCITINFIIIITLF